MSEAIRIDGLREFVRDLKTVDRDLAKGVRLALNAAANLVIDDARPHVPVGPTGRAAKALAARSTQTKARVKGGSARAPYYPWLDFGGRVGPNRSTRRPFMKHGRYLYRSYFSLRDSGKFVDVMRTELVKLVESAGIEVT